MHDRVARGISREAERSSSGGEMRVDEEVLEPGVGQMLLDAATPLGALAGAAARDLYADVTNASVQATGEEDPVTVLTAWIGGAGA